jgi:hypothetical protein
VSARRAATPLRAPTPQRAPRSQDSLLASLICVDDELVHLRRSEVEPEVVVPLVQRGRGLLRLALDLLRELGESSARPELPMSEASDVREAATVLASIADLCAAGAFDLGRALRRLTDGTTPDEALANLESAQRKLARLLCAMLATRQQATATIPQASAQLLARQAEELCGALSVRALYAEFRCRLRRAEPRTSRPDAVLESLRYAAGALATLTASPAYAFVRLPDRVLFRRLKQRILEWHRSGSGVAAGQALMQDIVASAELLRELNHRQNLRAHDDALICELLTAELPPDAWFSRASVLRGLDDGLDELLARHTYDHDALAIGQARLRTYHDRRR